MGISITQTDSTKAAGDLPKTHNVYDNLDKLRSVVYYDANQNVEYVLEASNNSSGKALGTKKYYQVGVDVVQSPANITFSSATLKARIYKNEGSKVHETGFIYWTGNEEETVVGKTEFSNPVSPSIVLKGNFTKAISNLLESTTYYYRAYVKHEYGVNYSKVYQFTTTPFTSVFSIVGGPNSGPAPLTVNLSAVNPGTGNYTFGWNMTGGPVSFSYSVTGITITNPGSGYEVPTEIVVLVNNIVQPSMSAVVAYYEETDTYGVSAIEVPAEVFGFTNSSRTVTISTNIPLDNPATATAQGGIQIVGDYTTQAVTHTYLSGGQYTARAYAILGNQVIKQASKNTSVTQSTGPIDYSAQWSNVISEYGNNIVGAYDFRAVENYNKDLINDSDTNLLLRMDGTEGSQVFTDSSTNNISVTAFGNAQINTTVKKFGTGSGLFDGSGDYLRINLSNTIWDNDFTIEMWVNQSTGGSIQTIFEAGDIQSGQGGVHLYISSSQTIAFNDGFSGAIDAGNVVTGKWTHIAVVRKSGTNYLYQDGVLIGTSSQTFQQVNNNIVTIGSAPNYNFNFNGYIDNLRVSEIARYGIVKAIVGPDLQLVGNTITETDGDSFYNKVSLLLPLTGDNGSTTFEDKSTNNYTLTAYGNTQVRSITGIGQSAAYFDGNGDYITIPSDSGLAMGSGDFTVEAWVNPKTAPSDKPIIGSSSSNAINFGWDGSGNFGVANSFVAWELTGPAPGLNQWSHVAVSRQSGTMRIFINGNKTAEGSVTTNYATPATAIGGLAGQSWSYYNGYISELRVTKGVARYTSNFVPPNGPLPEGSDPSFGNVELLAHLTRESGEDFEDVSSNNFELVPTGNTKASTTQTKYDSSSLYFDGNGGLELDGSSAFNFFGTDFTVECWIYRGSGARGIISTRNAGVYSPWVLQVWNTGALALLIQQNGSNWYGNVFAGSTNIPTNQWVHVAWVCENNLHTVYVNGVADPNLTDLNAPIVSEHAQPSTVYIGTDADGNFSGYIEDLRITKGLARYTSNFTPPTGSLPSNSINDPDFNKVSLLLRTDPSVFTDSSSNNFTVTPYGNSRITRRIENVFNPLSFAMFDGTGDYFVLEDSSGFNFNSTGYGTTTPFTIEMWFYATNLGSTEQFLITKDTYGSNFSWCVGVNNSQICVFTHNINSDWEFRANVPGGIKNHRWYHVALTHDGTLQYVFLNGVLVSTKQAKITNEPAKVTIGCVSWNNPGGFFNGYIRDLRITKGAARYNSNFTPPYNLLPDSLGNAIGTRFTPAPAYAVSNETISVAGNPHTLVYVGSIDSINASGEVVQIAAQPIKYSQTGSQNVIMFSRPNQGLMPYNGADNNTIGYNPDGSEYYYVALSFLANNTVRYALRTPSTSQNGVVNGATHSAFNGYPMFGAGFGSATNYNGYGVVRLGMFINQAFSTKQQMDDLFAEITSGPVTDIDLT